MICNVNLVLAEQEPDPSAVSRENVFMSEFKKFPVLGIFH